MSVTQAAFAVVGAILGSVLLTLAGFFLYLRYQRGKVRKQEAEATAQEQASAALNRAVMSYIDKGEMRPGSAYPSYMGYAPSEYGDHSVVMSRPSTADKSAIPGVGTFNLALKDPGKRPSTGQPLERVDEDLPDRHPRDGDTRNSRRTSNWPLPKQG